MEKYCECCGDHELSDDPEIAVEGLCDRCNREINEDSQIKRIEIANKIAENFNAKVWAPKGKDGIIRVYIGRGYCQIENDGVNIDAVNRNQYDDVKVFAAKIGVNSFRR